VSVTVGDAPHSPLAIEHGSKSLPLRGGYLQDWLLSPDDWNGDLDAVLRRVARRCRYRSHAPTSAQPPISSVSRVLWRGCTPLTQVGAAQILRAESRPVTAALAGFYKILGDSAGQLAGVAVCGSRWGQVTRSAQAFVGTRQQGDPSSTRTIASRWATHEGDSGSLCQGAIPSSCHQSGLIRLRRADRFRRGSSAPMSRLCAGPLIREDGQKAHGALTPISPDTPIARANSRHEDAPPTTSPRRPTFAFLQFAGISPVYDRKCAACQSSAPKGSPVASPKVRLGLYVATSQYAPRAGLDGHDSDSRNDRLALLARIHIRRQFVCEHRFPHRRLAR